jgi:hypothetical protein
MDAKRMKAPQKVLSDPEGREIPPPAVYMVARSVQDIDNVNTIDILGERPFSV